MEPRLGHDFSQVRVHATSRAAESAQAIGAKAYTVGQDIVFGADRLDPQSRKGRRLIALSSSTRFSKVEADRHRKPIPRRHTSKALIESRM